MVTILCLAAFYSQAIPSDDHGARSISSRQSSSRNQEDQNVLAGDDSDSSDDCQLLHCNMNGSLVRVTIVSFGGKGMKTLPSYLSTSAALESQHILLRL